MELWDSFPFSNEEGYQKALVFGSNSSKLRAHVKYNGNKKVKSVVNIHVGGDFSV